MCGRETRIAAAKIDHTNIGNRPKVMPGARNRMMVAKKFRPPRMDDSPKVRTPARKAVGRRS